MNKKRMKIFANAPTGLAMLALAVLLTWSAPTHAIKPSATDGAHGGRPNTDYCAYIGIAGLFGIWPDGVVTIAYNHAHAPPGLEVAAMERVLLRPAFAIIEGLADVRFHYQGLTDASVGNFRDSVAVIGWDPDILPHVLGYAAPSGSLYHPQYGMAPYTDGLVALNADAFAQWFNGDFSDAHPEALSTVIHELLHLLGLGHPEHPISIMQTGIFRFALPQQDDVAGLQALYGPPDEFVAPPHGVELRPDSLPEGVTLETKEIIAWDSSRGSTGEFTHDPARPGKIGRHVTGLIGARARFANLPADTMIAPWWIDPLGNAHPGTARTANSDGRLLFADLLVEQVRYLPGPWTLRLAIGDALLTELAFEVEGAPTSFNRSPVTQLAVQGDDRGLFTLNLHVWDPEWHAITTDWHLPGTGNFFGARLEPTIQVDAYLPGAPRTASHIWRVSHQMNNDEPRRVFVRILDRIPGRSYLPGVYSVLESRYLATPAEPNVPTWFVGERLLHIPVIEFSGQTFSLDFRLTALAGVTFKFLSLNTVSVANTDGAATFEAADNSIHLPKMIVVDGDVQTEYSDLRFEVDFDANPIKMSLR